MEKRAREEEEEAAGSFADSRAEEDSLSSFSSSSFSCSHDYCDSDNDCDYEDESPTIMLDDNGFPPSDLSSRLLQEDNANRDSNTNRLVETTKLDVEEKEDSFASDFYRCGTDWSSLLKEKKNTYLSDPKATRLRQTNLMQLWGFGNNKTNHFTDSKGREHESPQGDDSSSFPQPQLHHRNKKMKAIAVVGSSSTESNFSSIGNDSEKKNAFDHLRPFKAAKSKSSGTCGGGTALANNNTGVARNRTCPFYKKIPGTPFTVDAFRYGRVEGCKAYILSHFHADHYGGLSKGWSHGPIYCTPITARLIRICLYVDPQFIHPLELDTEYVIEGIKVTMLDANHCPGAALIHFYLPNGQRYLHTGDFRASKPMHAYPLLRSQRINVLYLDTTYCNQKYRFPPKDEVLSFVVRFTEKFLRKQPKTLVVVGAYSIGKERVYLAIAKALGAKRPFSLAVSTTWKKFSLVKIFTKAARRRILLSFDWPELSGNLCSNGMETPLHVLPISSLRFEVLDGYLKSFKNQYTAVLAFRPTGWTYSETTGSYLDLIKPTSKGAVTTYGVPYSEHSSFTELQEFVQFLRPDKIIPTVNVGNAATRDKMQSYFRQWLKERMKKAAVTVE